MTCKTFEIRDRGTFIPALAVKLDPTCEADRYLLARAGFGRTERAQSSYVLLFRLGGAGEAQCIPGDWGGRTMPVAHRHILEHFDKLASGDVVDVQHVLAETDRPVKSEAEEAPL